MLICGTAPRPIHPRSLRTWTSSWCIPELRHPHLLEDNSTALVDLEGHFHLHIVHKERQLVGLVLLLASVLLDLFNQVTGENHLERRRSVALVFLFYYD